MVSEPREELSQNIKLNDFEKTGAVNRNIILFCNERFDNHRIKKLAKLLWEKC